MSLLRLVACIVFSLVLCRDVNAQKDFAKDADETFKEWKYYSAIEMYKKAYSKERNNAAKTKIIFQIKKIKL